MENLINDAEKKLSKCAKEAYAVALAPHHPSIVRTGASIALSAAPKRSKFMKIFLGKFGNNVIHNNIMIFDHHTLQ